MTTNFLQFAPSATTNILNDADYLASTARSGGVVPGMASSSLFNKSMLQTSTMVAALGTVMSNYGQTVSDANLSNLVTSITKVFTGFTGVTSKSANYTAAVADRGQYFICTSTFTLSLTAAATLGSGWYCSIRNDGTGIITIDPNAAELINGVSTITVYPGEDFTIVCDGTGFKTLGRKLGWVNLAKVTAAAASSIDFTTFITSDFLEYEIDLFDVVPGTNSVNFVMRVSTDAGATWKSGASDYTWSATSSNSGTLSTSLGDTSIGLNYTASTDGQLSNGAGNTYNLNVRFKNPSGTTLAKTFSSRGSIYNAANRGAEVRSGGAYVGTTGAINGIRFLTSSGTVSATGYLRGWRAA